MWSSKKVGNTLSPKPTIIPSIQEAEVGESLSKAGPSKSTRPSLKNRTKVKGLRVWLKWLEHLPGKHKALSLISSIAKKERKGERRLGCSSVVEHLPRMYKVLGSMPAPKKKNCLEQTFHGFLKCFFPDSWRIL
jgi:hypothetical protein